MADPVLLSGPYEQVLDRLRNGATPTRLLVDLDDVPYAGGALFTLSQWCPPDVQVIAVGTDDRPARIREVLRTGVHEYLVKPVSAEQCEAAFARLSGGAPGPVRAPVVAFVSIGGAGATALAAAFSVSCCTAGRYVCAVDFDRTFPALPFLFGLSPAPGLDQLLLPLTGPPHTAEALAAPGTPCGPRLSLYGYRWAGAPAAPPDTSATAGFLDGISRTSHCVVVDGLCAPRHAFDVCDLADHRVFVVEPSASALAFCARILPLFRVPVPTTLVVNAVRPVRRGQSVELPPFPSFVLPPVFLPFSLPFARWLDRGLQPTSELPRVKQLRAFCATLSTAVFDPSSLEQDALAA